MAAITITVTDDGTSVGVSIDPPRAVINPNDLHLQWNLVTGNTGWTWSTDTAGIIISDTPPSPYHPWDGTIARPNPGGQYVADGVKNPGIDKIFYKYTVNLSKPGPFPGKMHIDPDIENDPQPPDMDGAKRKRSSA